MLIITLPRIIARSTRKDALISLGSLAAKANETTATSGHFSSHMEAAWEGREWSQRVTRETLLLVKYLNPVYLEIHSWIFHIDDAFYAIFYKLVSDKFPSQLIEFSLEYCFFNVYFYLFWERDRETERGKESKNPKRAPYCLMWGLELMNLWDHDLSQNQESDA